MIALKKHIVLLLFGLLMFPALIFATGNKDSLSLYQSSVYLPQTSLLIKKQIKTSSFASLSNNTTKSSKKLWFKSMRYSGYARFYPYYRNMKNNNVTASNVNGLTVPITLNADDGYQQPLMLFRLEGNPTVKTSFQTELQFSSLFNRTTPLTDANGKLANLYVIFKLEGAVDTKIGHIRVIAGGGANWYRLSPSTLWGYQYRDDLFERYPWDPEGYDFNNRYNSAYSTGDIPRDQRFGMQATQGFILEGTKMPAGFDAAFLYGKVSTGAGFTSFASQTPLNMMATRIGKSFGLHKVGFNYFDQLGYQGFYDKNNVLQNNTVNYKKVVRSGTDSVYVEDNYVSQLVTSIDARFEFKKFSLFTELGGGSYLSNNYNDNKKVENVLGLPNVTHYKRQWGETMFLEITTKKQLTRIPLKLGLYRISGRVVNNAGSVSNTSVEEVKPSIDTDPSYYTNYYDGMITDVGQLANNRQGLNLFASKNIQKLVVKFDMGIAQEIINLAGDLRNGARVKAMPGTNADIATREPFTNSITFEHKLNALTMSRFAPYQRFTGAYGRNHSIFRRTFENIAITDTIVNYNKSFNTIDLELKYKFRIMGKELIMTNYNNYSSVQDQWSIIPVFSDKAFVRYFYTELMAFYGIHPKVTALAFGGMERVLGNNRTELADANGKLLTNAAGRPISGNGKATDQTSYGYGVGVDYNFHGRASIHWRGRWFSHSDKNFTLDQYHGFESTMEFKVFF